MFGGYPDKAATDGVNILGIGIADFEHQSRLCSAASAVGRRRPRWVRITGQIQITGGPKSEAGQLILAFAHAQSSQRVQVFSRRHTLNSRLDHFR